MAVWLTSPPNEIWENADSVLIGKITRWIDQAERLIASRFPDTKSRTDESKLDPLLVGDIVEAMVDRAVSRFQRSGMSKLAYPEVQMEWDDSGGAGEGSWIYLTLDEVMALSPSQATGAFSIRRPVKDQVMPW
ncbi:hypothetical protein WG936_05465 [Corynebacterium sp. H127]|uniref:hypothetical protein n=1 Tax=Corynebacterium sp. H127 TaxID=3133418 RepID=UPI00309D2CEE